MKFEIVVISGDRVIETHDNADEANARVKFLNDYHGMRVVKLRRVAEDDGDPNWRDRERARFEDGTYTEPPWMLNSSLRYFLNEQYPHHFCHISTKDPGMVAYTQNEEDGRHNRKTRTSPGAYLTKFASRVIDQNQIRAYAAEVALATNAIAFGIARTPEEIVAVYKNGPSSCMAKPDENFGVREGRPYPTAVYGAGDLALAYLKNIDNRYTARSLIWEEKKVYCRVYGDGGALGAHLTNTLRGMGLSEGRIQGARLLRYPLGHKNVRGKSYVSSFVCPFIDDAQAVSDNGTNLIIDDTGLYVCRNTNGTAAFSGGVCGFCSELRSLVRNVHDIGFVCAECLAKACFPCGDCGEYYCRDMEHRSENNSAPICRGCYRRTHIDCATCGQHHRIDCSDRKVEWWNDKDERMISSHRCMLNSGMRECGVCHGPKPTVIDLVGQNYTGLICPTCITEYFASCSVCPTPHLYTPSNRRAAYDKSGAIVTGCSECSFGVCNGCKRSITYVGEKIGRWSYCVQCAPVVKERQSRAAQERTAATASPQSPTQTMSSSLLGTAGNFDGHTFHVSTTQLFVGREDD